AQKRLLQVMDRYREFLDRLSKEDRVRLEAVQGKDRLELIRQLQQQQWYEQLPFKERERLAALPEENRGKELARLRDEDRWRKQRLARTKGPPVVSKEWKYDPKVKPAHRYQYPPDVVDFIYANIIPRLSHEELNKLDAAEGKVGPLARLVVEYAEKYPVLP